MERGEDGEADGGNVLVPGGVRGAAGTGGVLQHGKGGVFRAVDG